MTLNITSSTHTYPIHIGYQLLADPVFLRSLVSGHQVFVVTDETIAPSYLPYLIDAFADYQCDYSIIPPGESEKNMATFERIIDELIKKHHHRDTTLIALGGGVIGDITGFVAACYLRGVDFIQIPTTLLAQVDASIGGKTAINHRLGKNLIGTFHHPMQVIIDISTLSTLPDREFRSGLAEIIKAALIHDSSFFAWLETHSDQLLARETESLQHAITRACQIKAIYVAADEKDKGERAHLNLGHTVGHALESALGFSRWLHGEAVAFGIVMAAQLSVNLKLLPKTDHAKIFALFKKCGLLKNIPKNIELYDLTLFMQSDKKIKNNQMRFVLLDQIGRSIISNQVTNDMLQSAWQSVNQQIARQVDLIIK